MEIVDDQVYYEAHPSGIEGKVVAQGHALDKMDLLTGRRYIEYTPKRVVMVEEEGDLVDGIWRKVTNIVEVK